MKMNKPNHIGIVVKDINEAKERFTALLGIKKWYEIVSKNLKITYQGEKCDCDVILYVGGKGATKIELIQSTGEKNVYTEFLKKHGEGFHHIMYNVKKLDVAVYEYQKMGLHVLQRGTFDSGKAKVNYAYLAREEDETVFELIETTVLFGLKKGDMPFETLLGTLTGSYKKVK